MLEEPPPPKRGRGDALIEACREDLDLFAVEELRERIEVLEAEIAPRPRSNGAQAGRPGGGRRAVQTIETSLGLSSSFVRALACGLQPRLPNRVNVP